MNGNPHRAARKQQRIACRVNPLCSGNNERAIVLRTHNRLIEKSPRPVPQSPPYSGRLLHGNTPGKSEGGNDYEEILSHVSISCVDASWVFDLILADFFG
jgi:hypothetical protein